MEQKQMIKTTRRNTACFRLGETGKPRLMLVHGNASSSAFFFPVIRDWAQHFDIAAPDLNGFGDTEASPIHSPTALLDWAQDVLSLADALGWEDFALLGWSLGGGVAWKLAQTYPQRVQKLILLSPMSPYGFGGTKGRDGQMYDPPGWGAPGGYANPAFLAKLAEKDQGDDPMAARSVLEKSLFAAGWPISKEYQDLFVTELLKIHQGPDYYPGDFEPSAAFPFVLPGKRGISNALAPQYADVSAFVDINPKMPVMWVRGDRDNLVSDQSLSDLATLGQMGLLPGYPGPEVFPPQPMVSQTRAVLEQYQQNGGSFQELVMEDCAHASHLEQPEKFTKELLRFLKEA